ncbi:unnamed protein product [Fusarium fujikuroi]|nr:unnamed protein product [Fusarium fujikuroi]
MRSGLKGLPGICRVDRFTRVIPGQGFRATVLLIERSRSWAFLGKTKKFIGLDVIKRRLDSRNAHHGVTKVEISLKRPPDQGAHFSRLSGLEIPGVKLRPLCSVFGGQKSWPELREL